MIPEQVLFFTGEAIRHARTLPIGECTNFLRGMLNSLHYAHPVREKLSTTVYLLDASDAQLELIASGQLKLDLEPLKAPPTRKRGGRAK